MSAPPPTSQENDAVPSSKKSASAPSSGQPAPSTNPSTTPPVGKSSDAPQPSTPPAAPVKRLGQTLAEKRSFYDHTIVDNYVSLHDSGAQFERTYLHALQVTFRQASRLQKLNQALRSLPDMHKRACKTRDDVADLCKQVAALEELLGKLNHAKHHRRIRALNEAAQRDLAMYETALQHKQAQEKARKEFEKNAKIARMRERERQEAEAKLQAQQAELQRAFDKAVKVYLDTGMVSLVKPNRPDQSKLSEEQKIEAFLSAATNTMTSQSSGGAGAGAGESGQLQVPATEDEAQILDAFFSEDDTSGGGHDSTLAVQRVTSADETGHTQDGGDGGAVVLPVGGIESDDDELL